MRTGVARARGDAARRLQGPPQVTAVERMEGDGREARGERLRLTQPLGAQRTVQVPLQTPSEFHSVSTEQDEFGLHEARTSWAPAGTGIPRAPASHLEPHEALLGVHLASLGVIHAASLSVYAIGQALAVARENKGKHGVKQVDRLLSNTGVDVWNLFSLWVPYVMGQRTDVAHGGPHPPGGGRGPGGGGV